jgi:AcrR family transcriptional regulator
LEHRSEAELRAGLIAAARILVARDGKVSLKQLYAESGIDRAGFYRCFASKEALLAAIVQGDVQSLQDIAQVAKPQVEHKVEQTVAQVGGAPIPVMTPAAPSAAPQVDAWLERRLRVFERALSALESRQEKSERDLAHHVAVVAEKFAAAPAPLPAPAALGRVADTIALPSVVLTPAGLAPAPLEIATPVDDVVFAPLENPAFHTDNSQTPPADDAAGAGVSPGGETEPVMFAADALDVTPEREIHDLIAQARSAANRAALEKPEPAHNLSLPRWIGWMGVGIVAVLICAGLALGNVARATQTSGGITARAAPRDALSRVTALADSGDARAQTVLALAYLRGQMGVTTDDVAARRWSLAAAEQGEPVAQYMVATLMSKEDAARAFSWFEQAALRGNIKAMHNLAIAYAEGQGTAEDDRRAAAWFNRAANQGYVDSQFDLAVLFERGQGVTQNRIAALKWYLIAARGGDGPSKARAEQLRLEMTPEEIARAEELVAAWQPQARDQAANAVYEP